MGLKMIIYFNPLNYAAVHSSYVNSGDPTTQSTKNTSKIYAKSPRFSLFYNIKSLQLLNFQPYCHGDLPMKRVVYPGQPSRDLFGERRLAQF